MKNITINCYFERVSEILCLFNIEKRRKFVLQTISEKKKIVKATPDKNVALEKFSFLNSKVHLKLTIIYKL